jgi:cysteine desulfurase
MTDIIYLDNSATTRAFKGAADTVAYYMNQEYFNASGLYQRAVSIDDRMEQGRRRILTQLGGQGRIIFTSGGTESNNMAILGAASAAGAGKGRFITSATEHAAVYNVFKHLAGRGYDVVFLKPRKDGTADPDELDHSLTEDTVLVSLMHVNNETGAINDIEELGYRIKKRCPDILFHCDGVQAFLKLPVNADRGKVDMYSISSHKFHGPKGVGALYLRKGLKLPAIQYGGEQENGYRPGTYNTPGIMGMLAAIDQYAANQSAYVAKMKECKRAMVSEFEKNLEGIAINGPSIMDGAPHILNISFAGVHSQVLLQAVEEEGVLIGTGAACSSHKQAESRILLSMGISKDRAKSAVRLSLSPFIEPEQARQAAWIIIQNVKQLRWGA